ncbi:MAG: hypothetical protein ABIF80_01595, partial [Patescibacteria group bacterium]
MIYIVFLAFVLNIFLGFVVIIKDPKNILFRLFGFFSIITGLWVGTNFLTGVINSSFWIMSAYAFGALVPASGLIWLFYLLNKKISFFRVFIISILGLIFFTISYIDNLIVKNVSEVYLGGFEGEIGMLFPVYSLYMFGILLFFAIRLGIEQRKSEGSKKSQLRYLFIGSILFISVSLFVSFLLPLFGIKHLIPLDSPSSLFFILFSAYAIIRHRLMDIRLIIRRTTVYAAATVVVLSLGLSIYWFQTRIFGGTIPANVLGPIVLLVGIIIFGPLKGYFNSLANKYFFTSLYDYQKTLDQFAEDVTSTINLKEVANVVMDTIKQTMQIDNIGLFVKNKHYQPIKIIGFDEKELTIMVSSNRCRNFISSLRKPLVYEEIASNIHNIQQPKEEIKYVTEQMKSLDVAIILPLVTKGELISCVIMGKKISGDAYTHEDIRLLESLSNQAAISIENARLYNEVEGFNQTLKRKVDDATKRL